jgi:hypothetical protein
MKHQKGKHTVEAIIQGDWRVCIRIEERSQGLGIKAQLLKFSLNFLEAFLQLAIWDRLSDPVRRKAYTIISDCKRLEK